MIQMIRMWNKYPTFYDNFLWEIIYSILDKVQGELCYFLNVLVPEAKKENIADSLCLLFHYSGLLLLHILIHLWRINSRHYVLAYTLFPQHYNSLIQMSRLWKKHSTLYVIFPLGNHWFNIKEVTKDIADNYVSIFVLLKLFDSWNKEGKYSRNSMLDFPLL